MRVGICIPSGDMVHTGFALSLVNLARYTPPDIKLSLFSRRQALICDSRNKLAARALEADCEWLFWLDSDMTFPADALVRLLAHGVAVVGADYARRAPPYTRTGSALKGGMGGNLWRGLTQMEVMPFGCILTHSDVFAHLVEPPWFKVLYKDDGQPIGEDATLCHRLRGKAIVWRDDKLSLELGHLGEHEFKLNDFAREAVA